MVLESPAKPDDSRIKKAMNTSQVSADRPVFFFFESRFVV